MEPGMETVLITVKPCGVVLANLTRVCGVPVASSGPATTSSTSGGVSCAWGTIGGALGLGGWPPLPQAHMVIAMTEPSRIIGFCA